MKTDLLMLLLTNTQSNNCDLHASVQNSHQPRSGRCGQKEEEIAVNLWVIENTYIPLCLHLYLLLKPPHPFFLSGAHLLFQYTTNGTPFPILFSISHWTELMQTIVCHFAV